MAGRIGQIDRAKRGGSGVHTQRQKYILASLRCVRIIEIILQKSQM